MLVKLSFLWIVAANLCGSQDEDDWWYNMDDDWDTHYSIQNNPYYQTHQHLQRQMSLYGFAQHVGKINRGQIHNPELNRPRDRAYGYQSDFNSEDFESGAFRNPSKGQIIRASQALVDRGLANTVGEIAVMPVGISVQSDGTILVQTSAKQKNPCNPNPCSNYRMSQCDVVFNDVAKCSQHGDYVVALRWTEPDLNYMYFYIDPEYHDGTECADYIDDYMSFDEIGCGAIGGPQSHTDHSAGVMQAELTFTLTQLDDGTKYQDYAYQVVAYFNEDNPSISKGELVISYEGEVKQIVKIPQYSGHDHHHDDDDDNDDGHHHDSPDHVDNHQHDHVNNYGRKHYFFGCFRPYVGGYFLDTNGAGFYDNYPSSLDVIAGFKILDNGLCNALREWTGPAGYNHNDDQHGDDETLDEHIH